MSKFRKYQDMENQSKMQDKIMKTMKNVGKLGDGLDDSTTVVVVDKNNKLVKKVRTKTQLGFYPNLSHL